MTFRHPQRETLTRLAAETLTRSISWTDLADFLPRLNVVTAVDLEDPAAIYIDDTNGSLWLIRGQKIERASEFFIGSISPLRIPTNVSLSSRP